MKSSVRKSTLATKKTTPKTRGTISRVARSVKRGAKQTLREILLSKTFHTGFKVMIGMLITASALYGAYALIGDSITKDVIVSESEILDRVGKHIALPEGKPEAIVRVQDPESLRGQNPLYENVKVGDYIVMYPTLAVVYDLRNDHIVALKSTRR